MRLINYIDDDEDDEDDDNYFNCLENYVCNCILDQACYPYCEYITSVQNSK